jgi:hypothetical protein
MASPRVTQVAAPQVLSAQKGGGAEAWIPSPGFSARGLPCVRGHRRPPPLGSRIGERPPKHRRGALAAASAMAKRPVKRVLLDRGEACGLTELLLDLLAEERGPSHEAAREDDAPATSGRGRAVRRRCRSSSPCRERPRGRDRPPSGSLRGCRKCASVSERPREESQLVSRSEPRASARPPRRVMYGQGVGSRQLASGARPGPSR